MKTRPVSSRIALAALALCLLPGGARAQVSVTTLLSGLNNPHGLAFGPDGALYVTEAGTGGPNPAFGTQFFGATGSITRYLSGVQTRIATGLPSIAPASGVGATGPQDIVFDATGTPYVLVGLRTNPANRATVGTDFGQLTRLDLSNGTLTNLADIAGFEQANNPAGGPVDSNPFGLTAYSGGFLVVDAGANTLFSVIPGAPNPITTLAIFPSRTTAGGTTYESVPTAAAIGPDGAIYVGDLTGAPFPAGEARVWRVPVGGGTPTEFLTGFTNIIDLTFGPDGSLYVLEHDEDSLSTPATQLGALIRVAPDGTRTTLLGPELTRPSALTFGPDGALYVSNFGVSPGGGQVVRVAAVVPEPGTLSLLLCGLSTGVGVVLRRRRK